MQISSRLVGAAVLGIIVTFLSLLYFREFNWPDYYHIEYGLPAAWLVRTLSTIIGPTDKFEFQPVSFLLDWVLWSLVAFVLLLAIGRLRRGPSRKSS
jgi:hypothetical protein